MFDWSALRVACEHEVAKEIARPRVKQNEGWQIWSIKTQEALPEAYQKINEMTNLELLDLIARVASSNA